MSTPAPLPDERTFVTIGTDRYKTTIKTGSHTLIADEPEKIGGTDLGPDPFSLLLASLGSCAAITARMYADRKAWPLDKIEMRLSIEEVTREGAKTKEVVKDVKLIGPLSPYQKERIIEMMDKCPVQRFLAGENLYQTNLMTLYNEP